MPQEETSPEKAPTSTQTAQIEQAKQQLRSQVRASRAARTADAAASAASHLATHARELCESLSARTVACFVGVKGEPDTMPFIRDAWELGITVLLPACDPDDTLRWVRTIHPATEFAPGAFGIPEPVGERLPASAAADADLLLIPACAVGQDGTRLGWGRGFYDRMLADIAATSAATGKPLPRAYAIVHDDEVFASVPHLPHDRPVDGALTAAGVRRFASRSH